MDHSRQTTQEKQGMVADGFSSEQELYVKKDEEEKQQQCKQQELKEKVKYVLPPPQQIKSKAYSLLPDKLTGWGIKSEQCNPIPTTFGNRYLDNLVTKILSTPGRTYPIVYLGPRYENTFYAWRDKPFPFPYSHINMPKNIKYKKRPFLGQNPEVQESIQFDSVFESGNLDAVVQVNSHEYDLFVRVDSNTRGHFNWFNFVVKGLTVGERYRFNICNMERGFCLYSRGMKPYVKSLKKKGQGWRQNGTNVSYTKREIRFARHYGFQPQKNWTLSFEIQTDLQGDEVQIAYCIPYTYSHMLKVIESLQEHYEKKRFIKETLLCTSLGGLPISLMTITQPEKQQENTRQKKCIILCGRVHPGESNGSFMMEGFLKFICGHSAQAKSLRKCILFKVVPMLNPDGVVLGNYRTGLSGKDFNREYRNPNKDIFPEVYFFKKLVTQMKLEYKNNLFMFLDLHGHSTKKNVFAYGPQFAIADKHYYQSRVFAKMLEKQNNMFRYHSCVFKVSECKLATARAILLRKINIPLTYTIEASNGFYHDKELLVSVPFVADQWLKMGASIGRTINEYVQCMMSTEKVRQDRQRARKQASKAKVQRSKTKSASISPAKKQSFSSIVSSKQDQKIKKIYQQILRQQSQGPQDANSDDNISEGSSDKQDDKDDLSKKQLQTLFNSIKNNNKLGKNRFKKGKGSRMEVDFEEDLNEDLSQEETKVQEKMEESKNKFRIKNMDLLQRIIQPIESSEQVFIADRSPKKPINPPKLFSQRRDRTAYNFARHQQLNSTKIINYKFQQERSRTDYLQTITIFPSFALKSRNTIVFSERVEGGGHRSPQRLLRGDGDCREKSHRSIVIGNGGGGGASNDNTPRSIKLTKSKDGVDKQIGVFGARHRNQLEKKLELMGLERFDKTYTKFTKSGFYPKRDRRNASLSFSNKPLEIRTNFQQ